MIYGSNKDFETRATVLRCDSRLSTGTTVLFLTRPGFCNLKFQRLEKRWRQSVTENEQRSQKQLANWLRRKFEGQVPADILANLSDENLIRQYKEDKSRKIQMMEKKKAGGKIKVS
jgi:hypothetical protein